MSGIYIALIDRFVYIGKSVKIKSRIAAHKASLDKQIHHNSILQSAYNKYGVIDFIVLELCAKKDLIENELFWIQYFKYIGANVINLTKGGEGCLGRVLSDETREKISNSNKGQIRTQETRNNISNSIKGKVHTKESIERGRLKRIGQKRSQITRDRIQKNRTPYIPNEDERITQSRKLGFKPVSILDPDGNVHIIQTINGFCRDHNLNAGHIHAVINGTRNHHKGWKRCLDQINLVE